LMPSPTPIGVGEGIKDLQVFDKLEFVDSFFN